jgi:DNA-binding beta-propeller fold protein YncE
MRASGRVKWRTTVRRGTLALGVVLAAGVLLASSAYAADWEALVTDASSMSSSATPIDLGTDQAGPAVATGGAGGFGVAVSPDGRTAYVVNAFESGATGQITPIDLTTDPPTPLATINIPSSPGNFIAISPDGRLAYMTDPSDGKVFPIDLATTPATVESAIVVGGNPEGIAFAPDGATAYVAMNANTSGTAELIPITVATNTAGMPITGLGSHPFSLAVAPDGSHLYVGDSSNGDVYPVALPSGAVGSALSVGGSVRGITVLPDGSTAYAADGSSVTPISLADDSVGTAVPVSGGAWAIAAAPDSKTVYVTDDSGATVTPIATATGVAGMAISSVGTTPRGIAITPDQAPVASFTVTSAPPGAATTFDAAASTVAYGSITRYDWTFGDGQALANGGPTPTHAYATPGTYTATVTETDSDGTSTTGEVYTGQSASSVGSPGAETSRSLVITTGAAPAVSLSASQLSFGTVEVDQSSAPQTVTVTNTGTAPLTIAGTAITGPNAGDFSLSDDGCAGATVPAGGTCSASVSFRPAAAGTLSAQLAFTDNASGSPQTLTLHGTGATTGTVTGTVEDGSRAGDPPLAGATATLCQVVTLQDCLGVFTDSAGRYVIAGVAPGNYVVMINPPSGSTLAAGSRLAAVTVGQTVDATTVLEPNQPLPSSITISSSLGTTSGGNPTLYWDSPFEITLPPLRPLPTQGTPNTDVETTIFVTIDTGGTGQTVIGSAFTYQLGYNASGRAASAVVLNTPLPGTISSGFDFLIGGVAAPPGVPVLLSPAALAATTTIEAQSGGLQMLAHGTLTLAITPTRSSGKTAAMPMAGAADECQNAMDEVTEAENQLRADTSKLADDSVTLTSAIDNHAPASRIAMYSQEVKRDAQSVGEDQEDLDDRENDAQSACNPPEPPPEPPPGCANNVFNAEIGPCPAGGQVPVDPSGFVVTRTGVPLQGAEVLLERSDRLTGPFTAPPSGNHVMAANNRRNPDHTDLNGHFGWDVFPGFYRVRATRHGCKGTALSATRMVPPPVTNLRLVLDCPGLHRAPTRIRIIKISVRDRDTDVSIQLQRTHTGSRRGLIGLVTLDGHFAFLNARTDRATIVIARVIRRGTRLTLHYPGNARFAPTSLRARTRT